MLPCSTFSTRATRKISVCGLVTENTPWKREAAAVTQQCALIIPLPYPHPTHPLPWAWATGAHQGNSPWCFAWHCQWALHGNFDTDQSPREKLASGHHTVITTHFKATGKPQQWHRMRGKGDSHLFDVVQAGFRDPIYKALARTVSLGALCSGLRVILQHLPDTGGVQVHVEVSWNLAITFQVKQCQA